MWTQTPPEASGWCWVYCLDLDVPEIVYVRVGPATNYVPIHVWRLQTGWTNGGDVRLYWSDPIAPPPAPPGGAYLRSPIMPTFPEPPPGPEIKPKSFQRGARRTPQHVIRASPKFRPPSATPPPQVAYVPTRLDVWGNDQHGDCVTAEEAFARATYQPEIFVDSATVVAWAQAHGVLEGADLAQVLDMMLADGFQVGAQKYDAGGKSVVDYTTEGILQAALAQGPVKIAIDAGALPSGAGQQSGWYAVGGTPGQWPNTDHCVSLAGYGPARYLYSQLGTVLPAALDPQKPGYLLYTWATLGFVDHAWLMSTCTEAWLRTPTTVGVPPLDPTPPPPPPPPPGPIPPGPVDQAPAWMVSYVQAQHDALMTWLLAQGVHPMGRGIPQSAIPPWILALLMQLLMQLFPWLFPTPPPVPPSPPPHP
jgi:hypothetical protein